MARTMRLYETPRRSLVIEATGAWTWSMTTPDEMPDDWLLDMAVTARKVAALDHPGIGAVTTVATADRRLSVTGTWSEGASLTAAPPTTAAGWAHVGASIADAADASAKVGARCGPLGVRQIVYGDRPVVLGLGVTSIAYRMDRGLIGVTMHPLPFRMSPEEMGAGTLDTRTDAFHIAYFLFERIAGMEPYDHSNEFTYIMALRQNALRDPREHGIEGPLAAILARCFMGHDLRPTARWLSDELARI